MFINFLQKVRPIHLFQPVHLFYFGNYDPPVQKIRPLCKRKTIIEAFFNNYTGIFDSAKKIKVLSMSVGLLSKIPNLSPALCSIIGT